MPAEPAAAPDASGASESTATSGAENEQQGIDHDHDQEHEPESPTVGGRAQELLKELGVPDEVRESLKPTEKSNAKAKEAQNTESTHAAGESKSPEGADAGRPTAGAAAGKEAKAKGPAQAQAEEEEKPLTDQEKSSWPAEALARIHKVTAQKKEAQRAATAKTEEARQLQEQLQGASRVRPAPSPHDPLADVMSAKDLHNVTQHYEELLAFAEMNPDGATDVVVGNDAQGNPIKRDFPAQEMARIRAETGRILRQAVPARAGYLREQQQHEQYAKATLPEMFDPATEEYQAAQQVVRHVPELTRLPGYQQWIAWAFIGRAHVLSKLKAADEGAANGTNAANGKVVDPKVAPFLRNHPPVAPSVPSTRGASVAERPSKDSERKTAVEQFTEEGGGDDALEKLVARTRSLQAAPKRDAVLV